MIRIITAIDINTNNARQAYRLLRQKLDPFFDKESMFLGYETTDEWYREDGTRVSQNSINYIGFDYEPEKEQTK